MSNYIIEQRVAESIAREAGRRILRAVSTGFDVHLKGQNDFVTNIDRSIEDFVKAALLGAFPTDAVFGEEHGSSGESSRCWFVDPIDGTTNFVRGVPMYCVSIALRDGEQWVAGVVYDPNRDELFSGRRGGEVLVDGVAARVAQTPRLADSVVATGFPPRKDSDAQDNVAQFGRVIRVTRAVRRLGSAALDLAYVACGRLDGFWEFHLNPWDTGAAAFLVELGGGEVTTVGGDTHTGFEPSILATNAIIHPEFIQTLREP